MKPRRTLLVLVVIIKKVEWGILSVADIAVKRVNFRLHRSGGRGRLRRAGQSTGLSAARAGPSCRLYGHPGAGVGFAGYLRLLG